MKNALLLLASFIREDEGASAVEYAILIAAIATVIIAITLIVGGQVSASLQKACTAIAASNPALACGI